MRIVWGSDAPSETGLDRGVLYLAGGGGVPWNGLVSGDEGSEEIFDKDRYFDGINYTLMQSLGSCAATLQAYTSPEEFDAYDGYQDFKMHQGRREFGLSWREPGNEIHILYNCLAMPSKKQFATKTNALNITPIAWDIATRPIAFDSVAPTAHLVVRPADGYPSIIEDFEGMLYGTDSTEPYLPTPQELFEFFETASMFIVVDNGDGSFSVTGPDEMVHMLDATSFELVSPSAIMTNGVSYSVSSY